jgi:hypothetical protein
MKLRTRIAAVLGTLALVAGLGVATSGPASALTTRSDLSFEGDGGYLESGSTVGGDVEFGPSGRGFITSWDYQAEGSAGGDGTYYYLHPHGYDNLCVTASTTQYGVIKIETCVAASQQYWWNPHNSSGYYELFNGYYAAGAFLKDPSKTSGGTTRIPATLTKSCTYGYNGCTFSEP